MITEDKKLSKKEIIGKETIVYYFYYFCCYDFLSFQLFFKFSLPFTYTEYTSVCKI